MKSRPQARLASARRLVRQIGAARLAVAGMVLALAVLVAHNSWHLPLFLDAEHALFDARVVVSAPLVRQDDRILIVPYTDETLISSGKRSPLDRAILARALARIDGMGAKAIGIDILMDQPQAEDPQLIATFRHMRTPTWLAVASNSAAADKILYRQQQFLDGFHRAIAGPHVHAASIVQELTLTMSCAAGQNRLIQVQERRREWPMPYCPRRMTLPGLGGRWRGGGQH